MGYPGPVQRIHHLRRWYLHLQRHVLRSLRHSEAPPPGRLPQCHPVLPSGWGVTITGLMSYPIDTVRRRVMMTSGGGAKYKGSLDCFTQVLRNEGFMSLMKGAGANILRGVAGAGVLAGFDKFQQMYIAFRTGQ